MAIPDKKSRFAEPRVFISYSRKDGEAFAKNLRAALEAKNIPLWQDRVGMEGGKDWWLQIVEALNKVEFMVLIMTPKAMASDIIRKEWRYARQKGVCVYPVKGVAYERLDYDTLPRWMKSAHFYDLDHEWEKFINDLNTRCQEPRVPFMAEDLPDNFVQRSEAFNALMDQLLNVEREEPIAITTALRGAGGYGKTTLAMAICHDERIQEVYDDGILWVTLGEAPGDITEKIKNLIETLSGKRPGFTDKETAAAHLSELLADRDILIVIDDAWNRSHLQPFLRGGPRCSRLITTRNSDTLPTGSRQNILDAMQIDEAQNLLAFGLTVKQNKELQYLSKRLGHWPIVLNLANAFLLERVVNSGQSLSDAIAYILRRLDKYGITALDSRDTKERNQAVEATLSVSLEILNEHEKQRFDELAIFPEDVDIPLKTVEKLWSHAGFDELDTEDLCERLFRLSLLQRFDLNIRRIRLHDVIRGYLRAKNKNQLDQMQARFLAAYPVDQWADLPPSDPYLWKHLAFHLSDGHQADSLRDLLCDYHWIERKLEIMDVNAILSDFDYLPEERELSLIHSALRLSANQLAKDPNQLPSHLFMRLNCHESINIQHLLQQAKISKRSPWCCPLFCSLTPAGGPLVRTFEGHDNPVFSVAFSPDGKTALSGAEDNTLKLWNLDTGKVIHTLEDHDRPVQSVAFGPNGKTALSGAWDNTLKLWSLDTGKVIHALEGHGHSVNSVAFSPDGKTALSGAGDKTLKLWSLDTGEVITSFIGESPIFSVAVSPCGNIVLAGDAGGRLLFLCIEGRGE